RCGCRALARPAQDGVADGAGGEAVAALRRALAEPQLAARADLLRELGSAERLTLGATASTHLREALALTEDPRERGWIALELGRMLFMSEGGGEEAVEVLEQAITAVADADPDLRQRLEAALLTVALEEPALYTRVTDR